MRPDPKVAPLLKRASFSKLLRIVDLPAPGLPTTSMFVLGVAESPVGNILYFIKNYYIFIIILLYFIYTFIETHYSPKYLICYRDDTQRWIDDGVG